jgi:hypothetical protein
MDKPVLLLAAIVPTGFGYAQSVFKQINHDKYTVITDYDTTFGKAKELLGDRKADICLVPHGNRAVLQHKPRFDYLDTLSDNLWCVMGSHLPDYILYDRNGYSGGSTLALNPDLLDVNAVSQQEADALFEELREQYVYTNSSKYSQPETEYITDEPYLVVMGQVSGDSAIKCGTYYTDYITTMLTLFPIINTFGIPIVYKTHPLENGAHSEILVSLIEGGTWENITVCKDASIHSLFESALGVITVNSGSGFEALLHLKHVFVLGRADYSLGATVCDTTEGIHNIKEVIQKPVDEAYIKRFVKGYLDRTIRRELPHPYSKVVDFLVNYNE